MSRLGDYVAIEAARQGASRGLEEARRLLQEAEREAREARYQAIVEVVCPFCHAEKDEPCRNPGLDLSKYVTHVLRDDLSGVNGERSRARAIAAKPYVGRR